MIELRKSTCFFNEFIKESFCNSYIPCITKIYFS